MIILCKPNRVARSYLGGRRLDRMQGVAEPKDGFFPEEWVASTTRAFNMGGAPDEGLSVTPDGRFLADILAEHPEYLGGFERLPILLKLLDASERLVIQAHPTVPFAKEHFGSPFGKAECWYILDADPDAHVYLGFKPLDDLRARWIRAFDAQNVQEMLSMLHRIPVKPGDVWYVDGGVPHAIGGGCIMAELQEPTDLMVIPEKVTPSGRVLSEQKLHGGLGFEKMFDVFDYRGYSPEELRARFHRRPDVPANVPTPIIDGSLTEKFRLTEYRAEGKMTIPKPGQPAVAVVVSGSGEIGDSDGFFGISAGNSLFIPATAGALTLRGSVRILIAEP